MSNSVYKIVTDQIMSLLEKGVIVWRRPWSSIWPMNFKTKRRYHGLNVFILSSKGYSSPYWLSFKQVGEFGGRVKSGEKGTLITFWKWLEVEDGNDGEEGEEREDIKEEKKGDGKKVIPYLRYSKVWNLEQTEGIKYNNPERLRSEVELLDEAEKIIANMPKRPPIEFGGDVAFYDPKLDYVKIPNRDRFYTTAGYYGTIFHELGHSTGHPSRLNRPGFTNYDTFGSENYSKEELVAEMTASFLLGYLGFLEDPEIENSTAYIGGWLERLKKDSRLVVQAAAQAQKAADYILGINEQIGGEEED